MKNNNEPCIEFYNIYDVIISFIKLNHIYLHNSNKYIGEKLKRNMELIE